MSLKLFIGVAVVLLYLSGVFNKDYVQRCKTKDNFNGVCVKKSECNEASKLDPTTLFEYREGGCHYMLECCRQPKTTVARPPVVTSDTCGWSNPGANMFRSRSRTYADYGEFPWMIALLKNSRGRKWSQKNYLGGGSLIHQSVVMTVAHKVYRYSPNKLKCRAGEWDTQTDNEVYEMQERKVKKIITHEEFNRDTSLNNIALLVLEEPFSLEYSPHIGIACIGQHQPASGTKCYSMGWGADFNSRHKYAVILKKLELPILDDTQCEHLLRIEFGPHFILDRSLMCAGGEHGADTCAGDGGSPLVCSIGVPGDTPRYAVFGMVAFGSDECGFKDTPGAYVNVPHLNQWIRERMNQDNFDTCYEY